MIGKKTRMTVRGQRLNRSQLSRIKKALRPIWDANDDSSAADELAENRANAATLLAVFRLAAKACRNRKSSFQVAAFWFQIADQTATCLVEYLDPRQVRTSFDHKNAVAEIGFWTTHTRQAVDASVSWEMVPEAALKALHAALKQQETKVEKLVKPRGITACELA